MDLLVPGRVSWLTCICVASFLSAAASAQTVRSGRLLITVVDPSGGVVPGATVTVVGLEVATRANATEPAKTTDAGMATVEGLVPGRYSIQAQFTGFDFGLLRDIRVRSGDNKHVVVLPLMKLEDSVAVGPDRQSAGASRANVTFGTALSREQIEALSDDPSEAAEQLKELGGAEAIIRVDSFEGQQLPPKSQIKSIHVTRDQFAAETEQPGSIFVDVITQPGVGPIRGTANLSLRDGSLSARSPFAPAQSPEQARTYGFNVGGALVTDKSNFSLAVNGRHDFTTPNLNAALPAGTRAEVLNLRQPVTVMNVNALLDYALTRDQTLRFGYSQFTQDSGNLGIGAYDLPERAYASATHNYQFRVLEAGPIGRRSFINTRLTVRWTQYGLHSAVEAPTIVVQDAFTTGGAQQAGASRSRSFTFASDLDHVRGIHSWRGGIQVVGGWFKSDLNQNYLGTYTFSSNESFLAGWPQLYTRQVGNPAVSYFDAQTGVYIQDDIRVRKGLTLSPGVRYSVQTHVKDRSGIGPRFGVTWSPSQSGRTTLRASAGVFNYWLPPSAYEQTQRLDGEHQRELVVLNPSYPDPGTDATAPLASKYMLGDFKLQTNIRYSGGVEHTFSPRLRTSVLYNYLHLLKQPRGRNLNAPINGVRPDPAFANIIESVTDTEIRRHELFVNLNLSLVAPSAALNRDRFNWRRVNVVAGYSIIRARNNGNPFLPFAVPPSGTVDTEWGPGPQDMPYRINVSVNSTQVRNLAVNVTWNATDGFPYNWTTGVDDNQDGLLNDRPEGVPLRSLRTARQSTVTGRVTYTFVLANPPSSTPEAPGAPAQYRLGVFVNVNNLTNRANYGGYSGVATSPFFEQPTMVFNPRKIDVGINVNF